MQKILVIGCPGSGKSTFARKLRDVTGLPLYPLDLWWHRPDGTHVSRECFDEKLKAVLKTDRFILDGNYQRTLKLRLSACDTVFFFRLPVEVCLKGAMARIGKKREDLPWVETELDEEFRQQILSFPEKELPAIEESLSHCREGQTIITFSSHAEADAYLARLTAGKA